MARLTKRIIMAATYVNKDTQETVTVTVSRVSVVYVVEVDDPSWEPDFFDDINDALLQYGTALDVTMTDRHELVSCVEQRSNM